MKRVILALVAATALAGCIKMDKTPPKDLPAYVKLYPGSTQVMNMNMGELEADAFTTTASADEVLTFYRTQAASDGLTETTVSPQAGESPGDKQVAFGDDTKSKLLVVVVKPQSTGGAIVSLTWKVPPKAAG